MEENINVQETITVIDKTLNNKGNNQIAGAILLAGVLIAGAVLLKSGSGTVAQNQPGGKAPSAPTLPITPVSNKDYMLGDPNAKVTLVEYADFQCPFCGKFQKDAGQVINEKYIKTGKINFVYRDYAFLGAESIDAGAAAKCAGDQGKFWEYHDYLFSHQNGENQGNFNTKNLKAFAASVGLDTANFNQCVDAKKYNQATVDATAQAKNEGVTFTPKGYILKKGKIVDTIEGAEPSAMVVDKIEKALK